MPGKPMTLKRVLALTLLLVSAAAGTWSSPALVNDTAHDDLLEGYGTTPILQGPDGDLHVVYHADLVPGESTNREVYYVRHDESWSEPERLSFGEGVSHCPAMSIDDDGNIYVFWYDTRNSVYYDLYWNRFDAAAGEWVGEDALLTSTTLHYVHPTTLVDNQNTVHLLWSEVQPGLHYEIFHNTYKNGSWGIAEQITDAGTGWRTHIRALLDDDGGIHIAWSDIVNPQSDPWMVYYRHLSPTGQWGQPVELGIGQAADIEIGEGYLYLASNAPYSLPNGFYQVYYSVKDLDAADDDWILKIRPVYPDADYKNTKPILEAGYDGVRLLWRRHLNGDYTIMEAKIGPHGFSNPRELSQDPGYYGAPRMTVGDDDTYHLVYSYSPDGAGNYDLYYMKDENPVGTRPPEQGAATRALEGLYPSPVNGVATVGLNLPANGSVELAVYDLAGRRVSTVHSGSLSAGRHELSLDAAGLTSGVYLLNLRTDTGNETTRFVVER